MERIAVEGRRVPLRLSVLEDARRHVVDFKLSPVAALEDLRAVVARMTGAELAALDAILNSHP